jgi:hypothetical protein
MFNFFQPRFSTQLQRRPVLVSRSQVNFSQLFAPNVPPKKNGNFYGKVSKISTENNNDWLKG